MSVDGNRADTFSVAHCLWVARFENVANFLKREENRKKNTQKNPWRFWFIYSQGLEMSKLGENSAKFFFPIINWTLVSWKRRCERDRAQSFLGTGMCLQCQSQRHLGWAHIDSWRECVIAPRLESPDCAWNYLHVHLFLGCTKSTSKQRSGWLRPIREHAS